MKLVQDPHNPLIFAITFDTPMVDYEIMRTHAYETVMRDKVYTGIDLEDNPTEDEEDEMLDNTMMMEFGWILAQFRNSDIAAWLIAHGGDYDISVGSVPGHELVEQWEVQISFESPDRAALFKLTWFA